MFLIIITTSTGIDWLGAYDTHEAALGARAEWLALNADEQAWIVKTV